jgi:hypothetical protein
LSETEINKISEFLKKITKKKIVIENKKLNPPFNILLSSSDRYYRENLHSDIIYSILKQKKEYLFEFISFLNILGEEKGIKINSHNYEDCEVRKEYGFTDKNEDKGFIDLLLINEQSKSCIIIENKINNAKDMNRQIPRYANYIKSQRYNVDAILYLSLDGNKKPDITNWTKIDHQFDEKIIYASAALNKLSMSTIFLTKCMNNNNCTLQEFTFFKQYQDLLTFLRRDEMDMEDLNKIYTELLNSKEDFNTAINIYEALSNFKKIWIYRTLEYFNKQEINFNISKNEKDAGVIFHKDFYKNKKDILLKFEIYPSFEYQYNKISLKMIIKLQDDRKENGNYISEDGIYTEEKVLDKLWSKNIIEDFQNEGNNRFVRTEKTGISKKSEESNNECIENILKKLEEIPDQFFHNKEN